MQSPDSQRSIKTQENSIYSIVLDENKTPEIIEGEVENAVFSGTYKECQAEILMSFLAD